MLNYQTEIKRLHPDFEYRFYTDHDMDRLMKTEFPEYYEKFNELPRMIMKIDMFRYFLMYKYGGLWLSPGTVFLQRDYHGLYKELVENDIVTFGSINPSHTYGEKHPDIRIIYSKPNLMI